MTRLVGVELRRMLSRRMARVFAVAAVIVVIVVGTITFFVSNRDAAGATVRARAGAAQEHAECLAGRGGPLPEEIPPGVSREQLCGEIDPSQIEIDPRFHLASFLDIAKGSSAPFIILSVILGASFIGAEWSHRTIGTMLTWEPRRVRVLLAKAIACAVVMLLAAIVLEVLLGLALVPAAVWRGTTAGIDGSWFGSVSAAVLRASVVAGLGSAIGIALASIARSTVAAVGVMFADLAVIEGILRGLKPQWQRWLLGDNAAIFVAGGGMEGAFNPRSTTGAVVLLSLYTAGLVLVAAAVFRRRDVT